MKKRSILIVDAEESHRKNVANRIRSHSSFALIGDCADTEEAAQLIDKYTPHLILMDADLREDKGFRVIAECSYFPAVIFTSHSDGHALKAFEHEAIGYLLKPVTSGRLQAALEKYLRAAFRMENRAYHQSKDRLQRPLRILVENGRRHKCISLDQVTHFKAEKDYTKIYTLDNKTYLSNSGISIIEGKVDSGNFIKIHRSYIVNTEHILGCYKDISKLFICLPNNHELSVGRTCLPAIRSMFF